MKIDLGGVLLGALIGLGAVLIVPKLTQLFSMHPNYRSLDDQNSILTDIMARLDNSLEQNHIDGNSCMQRVICSYVHEAQKKIKDGGASTIDEIIFSVSNNALFSLMLDGSTIKQAVDMGKQSNLDQCQKLYEKCPLTKDSVLQILSNVVP
nr:uncharacterized protein LOC111421983 [Onthophagus taurus]